MLRTKLAVVAGVAVVALSACGSKSNNEATTNAGPKTDVALTDYMITPHDFTATKGKTTFAVHDDGKDSHSFTIRDESGKRIASTKDLKPGEKAELTVDLAVGTFIVYCDLPGHESLGMKGTLTVR